MYHCIIRINIYSRTNQIENWLKQIPALEKFEYKFHTYDVLSDTTIAQSDIIILDLPYNSNNLDMVYNKKNEDTLLIACVFPEELAVITADEYKIIDDLWINPLKKESAVFYFSKVMRHMKTEKDLQLNQKYLDGVIECIPDMVWFKDLKGAHLKVNDSFCKVVGKAKDDIQGQSHYYIWDITKEEYEKGKHVCLDTDEVVLREKRTYLFNEKVKSKKGLRQLVTYKTPILDNYGEPLGTIGIARDVTDVLNIKAELGIVLEHIPFAILFYDNSGKIVSVNKSFEEYFCVDKLSIIGSEYEKWALSMFPDFKGNIDGNIFEAPILINNYEKIIRIHKEPVCDIFNNIKGYFCIYSDMTLEHRMQEEILHNANTDYLSGLYNRRFLYETINDKRKMNSLCLLYIDIDNFKLINDQYGHKVGDKALVTVAKILSEAFSDELVFRLGGDEFLVAITDVHSADKAKEYAQQFLNYIRASIEFGDTPIELSASIGIVLDTDPSIGFDELLKRGDSALYEAKQKGKNQYCIWNE